MTLRLWCYFVFGGSFHCKLWAYKKSSKTKNPEMLDDTIGSGQITIIYSYSSTHDGLKNTREMVRLVPHYPIFSWLSTNIRFEKMKAIGKNPAHLDILPFPVFRSKKPVSPQKRHLIGCLSPKALQGLCTCHAHVAVTTNQPEEPPINLRNHQST